MAERLHIDTSDEIIYRARKLRQRHDELVIQCEAGSLELQAENMDKKYPHVRSICEELQKKYAYADEDYLVIAPQNTFDIIKEGRMLHHCVGNDGAGERYYDRIERRESFIMFLRRAEEPEDPYYTLEIEPDGTVRQKRTLFDRQHEDIEQATEFCRSGKSHCGTAYRPRFEAGRAEPRPAQRGVYPDEERSGGHPYRAPCRPFAGRCAFG